MDCLKEAFLPIGIGLSIHQLSSFLKDIHSVRDMRLLDGTKIFSLYSLCCCYHLYNHHQGMVLSQQSVDSG